MVIETETKTIIMTSTFYPPLHIGGDAVHVKYLAEELTRRGHEVHVLHSIDAYRLKRGGALPRGEATDVHLHPIEARTGRMSPALTFVTGSNRRVERLLERLIKDENPDWVHHHNISLLGGRIMNIGNAPRIYTAHDYWLLCQRSDFLRNGKGLCQDRKCLACSMRSYRPYQFWRGRTFEHSIDRLDRIIAPSKFISSIMEHHLRRNLVVIPNFAPRIPRPSSTRNERPYFIFASGLEKYKGLHLLLDAYSKANLESDLHVAGTGTLEPLVRQYEKATGGRIRYLGFLSRDKLIEEMTSASCLVAPSACNENSPLSCIEALSLGRPLIVSRMGGLPELVRDPECGIVCDLTPDSLSAALGAIESDDMLRRKLSENAMAKYAKQHTQERYLSTYMKLVEEVLCNAS